MTLHLVRHARAGTRSAWGADDLDRPLDERGREQADAITRFFSDLPVRGVWSSHAVRCSQTVAGVAAAHGLTVELRTDLTEGARATLILEAMRDATTVSGDLVLCSHGDLIPEVLNRLLRDGMSVVGGRGCDKGSIWSLETRGRDIIRGVYTAAP